MCCRAKCGKLDVSLDKSGPVFWWVFDQQPLEMLCLGINAQKWHWATEANHPLLCFPCSQAAQNQRTSCGTDGFEWVLHVLGKTGMMIPHSHGCVGACLCILAQNGECQNVTGGGMLPVQLQDFWGGCSLPLHVLDDPLALSPPPHPPNVNAVLAGKAVSKHE